LERTPEMLAMSFSRSAWALDAAHTIKAATMRLLKFNVAT